MPAMNRPLKAAVCCPLAGHPFDRWGYGKVRAYKAVTSEGLELLRPHALEMECATGVERAPR